MSKFVIELDEKFPDRMVYLGLGLNQAGQLLAITAKQNFGSRDVSVAISPIYVLMPWLEKGNAERCGDPEWGFEAKTLQRAINDIASINPPTPRFMVDSRRAEVFAVKENEVIAERAMTHGYVVAVCDVKGAADSHVPSWGEVPGPDGRYYALRIDRFGGASSQCRPN